MDHKLILLLILFAYTGFAQDSGSLRGKITNADGEGISEANVDVQGTAIGTETNNEGAYFIKNIPDGNYLLRISYVGYKPQEVAISIVPGKMTNLPDVILRTGQEQLSEVVIQGNGKINKYDREKSVYVSKLPLKNIENPQVYDNITSELLEEQIITNFDDALKNSSGITKLWESTGRGGDGAGYYSLRGFPVQPNLVNGLPAVTNGSPDPANIENIEVIKGPSGTLYGSSLISYGGLINITTKRPYAYFGGNISLHTRKFWFK